MVLSASREYPLYAVNCIKVMVILLLLLLLIEGTMVIKHLLKDKDSIKNFTCIILFNPHNNLLRVITTLHFEKRQ